MGTLTNVDRHDTVLHGLDVHGRHRTHTLEITGDNSSKRCVPGGFSALSMEGSGGVGLTFALCSSIVGTNICVLDLNSPLFCVSEAKDWSRSYVVGRSAQSRCVAFPCPDRIWMEGYQSSDGSVDMRQTTLTTLGLQIWMLKDVYELIIFIFFPCSAG